jgi:transcriptional regulator with XRE-family HTH domain
LNNQSSSVAVFTDLGIADELKTPEFRNQFFRTERLIDIPAQIKTLRKLRKMTQTALAEKAGTKQSAVCRLERAQESNWELETLVKFAEALDARLAVVIEPYELAVARYRAESKSPAPSAATAKSEPPPKAAEIEFTPKQGSEQLVPHEKTILDRDHPLWS